MPDGKFLWGIVFGDWVFSCRPGGLDRGSACPLAVLRGVGTCFLFQESGMFWGIYVGLRVVEVLRELRALMRIFDFLI